MSLKQSTSQIDPLCAIYDQEARNRAAIDVNYYLGVILIKKKCTRFKDFMKLAMQMYMLYCAGLIVGTIMREIP